MNNQNGGQIVLNPEYKCAEVYRNKAGLYSFVCFYCGDIFGTFPKIHAHISDNHSYDWKNNDNDYAESNDKYNGTPKPPVDVPLSSDEDAKDFINYIQDPVKPIPEKQTKKECHTNVPKVELNETTSKLECPKVNTNTLLRFQCDICGIFFKHKHALKKHLMEHSNIRPFKCKVCNKGYVDKNQFAAHLKTHEEKKYVCEFCSKAFVVDSVLKAHLRIHTGEKPYHCPVCSKRFGQKSYIKIHMRLHNEGEQFRCVFCGSSYISQSMLNTHLKNHTDGPFICSICNKELSSPEQLKHHGRIHSNERNFHCKICDSKFKSPSVLRQHSLLHLDEKKYQCRVCDMRFNQSKGRRAHEKSRHNFSPVIIDKATRRSNL